MCYNIYKKEVLVLETQRKNHYSFGCAFGFDCHIGFDYKAFCIQCNFTYLYASALCARYNKSYSKMLQKRLKRQYEEGA